MAHWGGESQQMQAASTAQRRSLPTPAGGSSVRTVSRGVDPVSRARTPSRPGVCCIPSSSFQTVRQQLVNQRHALLHWPVVVDSPRDHLTALIDDLDTRLVQLEAEIRTVLTESAWAASATLLLTIPGIGWLTTAWLLVSTVNFTLCPTPEAAVSYAGLAPQPYASGTSVWRRPQIGHTGHARLRTALYLATLTAARFNSPIAAFYDRLCKAGKPKKVARCAAARKLLHQAWAVVSKQRPFDPNWGKVSDPIPQTP